MSSLSGAPQEGKSGDSLESLARSLLLRDDGISRYRKLLTDDVLLRYGYKCGYCGVDLLSSLDVFLTLTKDHLIPRRAGGVNSDKNRVACCAACDRLKGGALVANLLEARKLLSLLRQGHRVGYHHVRLAVRGEAKSQLIIP